MKENKFMLLLMMFVAAFAMASCSESDEDVEEFPNWKNYNDETFEKLYSSTEQKIASGDASWKIIRTWSVSEDYVAKHDDHIIVEVLSEGDPTGETPMYTDSIYMAYSGRLLPSTSFPKGYVFDKSYKGDFNPNTVFPMTTGIVEFVDGFTTAVMNMRPGDYWRVYIPSNLAYGNSMHAVIPLYSMLVFDIYLFDFFHPGQKPRELQNLEVLK